jgi:hypothetical protein
LAFSWFGPASERILSVRSMSAFVTARSYVPSSEAVPGFATAAVDAGAADLWPDPQPTTSGRTTDRLHATDARAVANTKSRAAVCAVRMVPWLARVAVSTVRERSWR